MEALTITPNLELPPAELERLYADMVRIRRFEERVVELFQAGLVKGTAHSYAGEEAIAVGACAHLRKDDYVASYHRGHGHCIAKGARTDRMMAELMGRATGYCQGLGGSMHVADMERNILGANGIVGAAMPLSVGAGLAIKLRGGDQVVIAFFGDGANNQGIFHESLNLAAVWQLPVLFVCENNQYALSTSYRNTTAVDSVATRAAAYDIPGVRIDGNDVLAVHAAVGEAVERARRGQGPSLIEAMTWRWGQHSMRANLRDPRSDDDMAAWIARDPIPAFAGVLTAREIFTGTELEALQSAARAEIDGAVAFAEGSPEPEPAVLEAAVYAPHTAHLEAHAEAATRGTRELTFAQALNEAMAQEMERDPSVFLMGEDVADTGGIFQVSKGLLERFGRERVRDTPISEATFCGAGVGAAIAGMRPIVEVQIFDFVTLMMDMLVNQAAKFRYMLGGRPTVPLVVRGPQGGGIRLAAQHSQSLEAWFAHVPGLVVAAPSSAYDAKGLLIAAIRDDNPVIFLEHKLLYLGQAEPVPEAPYAIPLGKAAIRRPGTDVTIVATQMMVSQALQAATRLEADGIDAEVIDPRTLKPLDLDTIVASVKRTNRLVVVHEGWKFGGFGGEIAASVTEAAFDWLDAPVARVGALDVPMPFNDRLERIVIPSAERIIAAVKGLYGRAAT